MNVWRTTKSLAIHQISDCNLNSRSLTDHILASFLEQVTLKDDTNCLASFKISQSISFDSLSKDFLNFQANSGVQWDKNNMFSIEILKSILQIEHNCDGIDNLVTYIENNLGCKGGRWGWEDNEEDLYAVQLPKSVILQHCLGRAIEWTKDSNLNRKLQIRRALVYAIFISGTAWHLNTQWAVYLKMLPLVIFSQPNRMT